MRWETAFAGERVERKLAAILAADIAGYSRLMGADEKAILARLKALRTELIYPTIKEHAGRIVKTTSRGLTASQSSRPHRRSFHVIGAAYFPSRRFDEALPRPLLGIQEDPSHPRAYRFLAACCAHV